MYHLHRISKGDFYEISKNDCFSRFPGGELNTAYNAIDRHVEQGFGDSIAIIHDSPVSESVTKITYKELQEEVKSYYISSRSHFQCKSGTASQNS